MAQTLFTNKTINPARESWGGGGQGSGYHTVGVRAPTYSNASAPTQVAAVECWSSATPITGEITLSGSMLFWPYSVHYTGNPQTYVDDAYFQLGLVVNDTGEPIPLFTYTNAQMTANNGGTYLGTKIEQDWEITVNVTNAASLKLAVLCYMTGGDGDWTNAEVSGTIDSAVYEAGGSGAISVNDGGTIKGVGRVYVNDNGTIKECRVYVNDNGTIRQVL